MSSAFKFASVLAVLVTLGAGCATSTPVSTNATQPTPVVEQPQEGGGATTTLIGGQRDEHGCLGPAGYSWCEVKNKCLRVWEESCIRPELASATTTVVVSDEPSTKYCDGANMDSLGFQKTITHVKTITLPATDRTDGERIKSILSAATGESCQMVVQHVDFTVTGDTVSISPVDAWAGVSIAMCSCKPLVETNLLRIPGIKHVVWE